MADVEYCCFVGLFPYETTAERLKKVFEKYGPVKAEIAEDHISGGPAMYGYVTFNDKTCMENAVKEMDDTDIDGLQISVENVSVQERDEDLNYDPRNISETEEPFFKIKMYECTKCCFLGHVTETCPVVLRRKGDEYGASCDGNGNDGKRSRYEGDDGVHDRYRGKRSRYEGGDGNSDRYRGQRSRYEGYSSGRSRDGKRSRYRCGRSGADCHRRRHKR